MNRVPELSALCVAENEDCELLLRLFARQGWKLAVAETIESGLSAIRNSTIPIVIVDRDVAGPDWRPAIRRFASDPHCECVILASRVVDDYLWDEVIHHGGYDVLAKPFEEGQVEHALEFAWSHTHRLRN
jgi:DNA-binding NtrC family response regulator